MSANVAAGGALWQELPDPDAAAITTWQVVDDPANPGDHTLGTGAAAQEITASGPGGDYELTAPGSQPFNVDRALLLQVGTGAIILT